MCQFYEEIFEKNVFFFKKGIKAAIEYELSLMENMKI